LKKHDGGKLKIGMFKMKILCQIFFLICIVIITSCASNTPTPQIAQALEKNRKLDSPRFLTETHYLSWLNSSTHLYVMVRPGSTPGCTPAASCMPTLKDYSQSLTTWQNWQVRKGGQFRILGLLPTGTAYHFYKIDPPEHLDTGYFVFYAMIDSGSFKGATVFYRYDEMHSDDVRLLREVSFRE
jgi:hypothetical protein